MEIIQTQPENAVARTYSSEDVNRLKQLVNEGCQILSEVELLKTGLNETIKHIAEEIGIKPAQLTKAIKIAHKSNLEEEKDKLAEIEDILDAVNK